MSYVPKGNRSNTGNIPTKCAIGKEWKDASQFSGNQIKTYQQRKQKNPTGITPGNSGVSCRDHSGELKHELQCQGPCGEWKALNKFSGNARRRGQQWCLDCHAWQSTAEPGTIPYAPPQHERSLDEQRRLKNDDDDDFDDETTVTGGIEGAMRSMHFSQGSRGAPSQYGGSMGGPSVGGQPRGPIPGIATTAMPPHMTDTRSGASSARAPHHYLPDFGGPGPSSFATESRPSAPSSTGLPASNTTVPPRATKFNAFDGQGGRHETWKAPTEASEVGSSGTRSRVTVSKSGWAKPESARKGQIEIPEYLKWENNKDAYQEDEDGSSDEC